DNAIQTIKTMGGVSPIRVEGSLWRAGGFSVASGLDWSDMDFTSGSAIILPSLTHLGEMNPSSTAVVKMIGLDNSGNVALSNGQVTILPGNGNVGVGFVTPSYKLDVNGSIRGYGIVDASDIRLKRDVRLLTDDFAKVLRLQGVRYYWRDSYYGAREQVGL